jgi:hypothetical protein
MNMEQFEIKTAEELAKERAGREAMLREAREKIAAGTATEEEKREVARADQLKKQAEIKKSFEN